MTNRHHVVTKLSIIRWTMKITLVLGLAMFSGPGPGFKSIVPTAQKTELAESRSPYSKRTVSFKKVCGNHSDSLRQIFNIANSLVSILWQYDNSLSVKFRVNFKMLSIVTDRDKTFQSKHHSTVSRDESDSDKSKG